MWWRNTAGVPALSSFNEYKQWYENTKPIRGHKDNVRPLGSRRHHRMASFDMPDADTIVLKYYGEPFVTWKSDDSFTVNNCVYNSAYSAQHLSFFLPKQWQVGWNACRMVIGNKGKFYLMPSKSVFHFVKAGEDYEMVNRPVAYAIRKKRGSDKHILAKCKPFFDWLTVVTAINNHVTSEEAEYAKAQLREQAGLRSYAEYQFRMQQRNGVSPEEQSRRYADYRMCDVIPTSTSHYMYVAYRSFHTPSAERLMQWVEDDNADSWVLAMHLLAERAGKRRFNNGGTYTELDIDGAVKYLTEVARHVHRDAIFAKEQLDDGVLPSRSNAVYFRSHSFSV